MLNQDDIRNIATASEAAVRAYEAELLDMMAREMAGVRPDDPVSVMRASVRVSERARAIKRKHEQSIRSAVMRDLSGAFYVNEQRELERIERWQ